MTDEQKSHDIQIAWGGDTRVDRKDPLLPQHAADLLIYDIRPPLLGQKQGQLFSH